MTMSAIDSLHTWYGGLAKREQRFVLGGAVAVVILLLLAVGLPLQRQVSDLQQRIVRKQADLLWMQSVAPTLAAAGPVAVAGTGPKESLLVLIDRTARESGLGQALTGSQPSGDGGLRVTLEKADFNSVVSWTARLAEQHAVSVQTATIESAAEPGTVNAGLVLQLH
jgi:type II secretory pathway component PulM